MVIEAFFLTATDARYAIRDLRRAGLEPSRPIPVQPPQNGRPWKVEVEPQGGLAERYPRPQLVSQVTTIVMRHNGITDQVDRTPV